MTSIARRNHFPWYVRILLTLVCLSLLVTGCDSRVWLGYGAVAAGGFVLGRLTAPVTVETTCFRDGIEVDCSTVPR